MAKNYYAILGISAIADSDEIKAAYRRLAKEFHPDRYSGGSDIFRQIQEASAILRVPIFRPEILRPRDLDNKKCRIKFLLKN